MSQNLLAFSTEEEKTIYFNIQVLQDSSFRVTSVLAYLRSCNVESECMYCGAELDLIY